MCRKPSSESKQRAFDVSPFATQFVVSSMCPSQGGRLAAQNLRLNGRVHVQYKAFLM